jgi:hypothetical protein
MSARIQMLCALGVVLMGSAIWGSLDVLHWWQRFNSARGGEFYFSFAASLAGTRGTLYVFTLAVVGVALIWAASLLRAQTPRMKSAASVLMTTAAIVLVMPVSLALVARAVA